MIPKRYFSGYPPKKTRMTTIENNRTAVDRLAGRINSTTINTGSHSGIIEDFKRYILGLSFDIMCAT
jgi:hypothetical protein